MLESLSEDPNKNKSCDSFKRKENYNTENTTYIAQFYQLLTSHPVKLLRQITQSMRNLTCYQDTNRPNIHK